LDGYPMAKRGEPGRALGLATVSSVSGGIISLIVFIVAAPTLATGVQIDRVLFSERDTAPYECVCCDE
jgi:TctA family transporter